MHFLSLDGTGNLAKTSCAPYFRLAGKTYPLSRQNDFNICNGITICRTSEGKSKIGSINLRFETWCKITAKQIEGKRVLVRSSRNRNSTRYPFSDQNCSKPIPFRTADTHVVKSRKKITRGREKSRLRVETRRTGGKTKRNE